MAQIIARSVVRTVVTSVLLVAIVGGFFWLSCGDGQANRWVFLWQRHVYTLVDPYNIPPDFIGTWRAWHTNGVLMTEVAVVDGKIHGEQKFWNRQGELCGHYWNESAASVPIPYQKYLQQK